MDIIKIKLANLSCSACAAKIEDKLAKHELLEKVSLNFIDQSVKITYSDISKEEVLSIVTTVVNATEDGIDVYFEDSDHSEEKSYLKYIRLVSGTLLILFMFFTSFDFEIYLKILTFLIFGYDVIIKALKKIFTKDIFNENFLMSFATVSAFAIGEVNEAIGVMLFYQIGEFFQDLAVDNSKKSIENLMDISTTTANLVNGDTIEVIDSKKIKIGDTLLVKVGEKIPVDAVVVEGSTRLDTSSLTGESVPVSANVNDSVLSGVINLSQVIKIEAVTTFDDSTASRIIDLVKESAAHKGETEKFITKFAKIYTPIVLLLALLLVAIPTLINPSSFNIWFERSLIFLVVSCPCALVASIPLTFFSGLGFASKQGILVKGSNHLQAVTKVNEVVFDKTGTLTNGKFKVTNMESTIDFDEFYNIVYNVEKKSNHPIATSIVEYISLNSNFKTLDYQVEEVAGMGLKAKMNGDTILIGNSKLLNSISHPDISSNGSVAYVALNNTYIGHIIVSDMIKEDTFEAIRKLKELGIKTTMLTGDNKKEADYISNTLELDNTYSSLLPHQKVEKLNDICEKNNGLTIFVGDGINDAPVLKRSDIGISMGNSGSDAAIEASDIVIMNDNLTSIIKLFDIAKNTVSIAKQNIVLALFIKVVVLLLGALGLASMWLAIFADVGVTLLAVLNASRKK